MTWKMTILGAIINERQSAIKVKAMLLKDVLIFS